MPVAKRKIKTRRKPIRTAIAKNKKRIICIAVALVLTSIFAYACFSLATEMQGSQGYVSDECWYVSSARNILREVFGVQPSYVDSEGMHNYTIFFSSSSDLEQIRENFGIFIEKLGGRVVPISYSKIPAISIAIPGGLDYENLLETFPKIEIIQSGYNYPDAQGIENYLNVEHPPLAKYIIGLSMLTLGDQSINWRIPGIIAGSIMILLVYLIVAKLIKNEFIALFVYLFAFTDPIFRAMSSIAMLDIYAAFFVTLSMWLAMRKNYFLSALAIGLASACKLDGLFAAPALFLFMIIQHKPRIIKKTRITKKIRIKLVQFARRLRDPRPYIYAFIIRFGPGWIANFPGNIAWFLHPQGASTPWGWFVNQNVFWMNFTPNVSASVNSVIYFMALIALIFVPYLARKINRNYLVPGLWFSTTFLGFVLMYILGRTVQYSYYAVIFSPMVYILACVLVYYFIKIAIAHIKFIAPILRNPKPIITKTARHPKLKIKKFLKIYKSSGPFVIRPHRVPKTRRTKRTKKRSSAV
jgi:predicted membrane-bound dolichyl-phosphate-mannose-protein mannosyltransferase